MEKVIEQFATVLENNANMMNSMAVAMRTLAKEVGTAGFVGRDDILAGVEGNSEKEVGQKRARKEKKVRDPTEPPRPSGAYLLFQSDMRKQEGFMDGKGTHKEKMQEMAQLWRSLSDEERKAYQDKAAAAMVEWRKAHDAWRAKKAKELDGESAESSTESVHTEDVDQDDETASSSDSESSVEPIKKSPKKVKKVEEKEPVKESKSEKKEKKKSKKEKSSKSD